MSERSRKLVLFALSGVFTSPDFMDGFRDAVLARARRGGWDAEAHSLMPYGDWSGSKLRQAIEVAADVCGPLVGGARAARDADRLCEGAGSARIALLGHSGGGIAALHAARLLQRSGFDVAAIAMIGSPKRPIPAALRDKTAFLYAASESGRAVDGVARAGAWLGRPPARIVPLRLIGGHPDYFRSAPPFVNERGDSNLRISADAAWGWVEERLGDGR
ncbi:hypothetical protein [Paenibacillus sp.]|uniref:hypothetical protein n=1 Tax=Paenibacillus sp. TaxID=58172 RepID=UPI002D57F228|nr:hypothetical protein [Paenibacillus sp.]HZG87672.1 hypothetical protein [Paenibacillus sp.]